MNYQFIKVSNQGGLITITLNSPPLNVLTIPMMKELADAFLWAKEQTGSLILLNAEGKAFSAGVDVADHTPDKVAQMNDVFDSIFHAMDANDKPIIGAVNGAALGGGYEVVLYCDMVVASDKAKFGQPEIAVGVFPPVACCLLPKLLSWPQAMEILLSGEAFNAAKAEKLGLVNTVLPADSFAEGLNQFLQKFLKLSPVVLALTK
ncbi:MAG: enoyl-CoA hydratase/isomerase family protein, partial [Firmicutes bacterium]|nr:enoyl-CoA hydratase/isomerase family protein [Bacillota bacterium]